MLAVLVALAGGVGAVVRFVVDGWVARRLSDRVPLGTVVVNVTGSFLLGLLTGWWSARAGVPGVTAVLGTGFLGGYTTFSTASVEAARLARSGRSPAAVVHAAGMLAGGVLAAATGFWAGSLAG